MLLTSLSPEFWKLGTSVAVKATLPCEHMWFLARGFSSSSSDVKPSCFGTIHDPSPFVQSLLPLWFLRAKVKRKMVWLDFLAAPPHCNPASV